MAPSSVLERAAGLDPQLLHEGLAGGAVGGERVRLAARPVQGEHELPASALPERLLGDERLELADELGVAPEGEVGVDPLLEGRPAKLLEPGDLRLRPRLVGDVGKRWAPPERQRLTEGRRGELRATGAERLPPLGEQALEAQRIELVGRDVEHVAGRAGEDRLAVLERLAQL